AEPEVQYTYHLAAGPSDVRDWAPLSGGFFVIPNPYPSTLSVVLVQPDMSKFSSAVVELEDVNAQGVTTGNQTFLFNDQSPKFQFWTQAIADSGLRRYRYRLTLMYRNPPAGAPDFVSSDWIDTDRPQLPLGESILRQLDVQAQVGALGRGVDHVTVHLQYD